VTSEDNAGKRWRGDPRTLPFYPARGEVDYLRNFSEVIDRAQCVS